MALLLRLDLQILTFDRCKVIITDKITLLATVNRGFWCRSPSRHLICQMYRLKRLVRWRKCYSTLRCSHHDLLFFDHVSLSELDLADFTASICATIILNIVVAFSRRIAMIVLVVLCCRGRIVDTFRAVCNIIFVDRDLIVYPKTLVCNALLVTLGGLIGWAAFSATRFSTLVLRLLVGASWVWDLFVLFLATDWKWITLAHSQPCWSGLLNRDWLTWT